jgi:hypothetical protein
MTLKKSQKIAIGISIFILLILIGILIWNNRKTDISRCPEWINCMPSPGMNNKCEIPKGCEDITQIAW